MLALGHVGYSIGATWIWNNHKPVSQNLDYRLAGLAAIGPDIVDRIIFIFLLENALQGRLLAHTLFSGLIIIILLFLIQKPWWKYGLLYTFHLILDSTNPPKFWLSLLFWPLLGVDLNNIGIVDIHHANSPDKIELISSRLETLITGYTEASWWLILMELIGTVILLMFVHSKGLLCKGPLQEFILHGRTLERIKEQLPNSNNE